MVTGWLSGPWAGREPLGGAASSQSPALGGGCLAWGYLLPRKLVCRWAPRVQEAQQAVS